MARLAEKYKKETISALKEKFNYKTPMQVPKVVKVIINMGVGEAADNSNAIDSALNDLTLIAGQKPIATYSKKSVAGFKLREGIPIGCKVTLRRQRMFEFIDRLINIALPRSRDFRGFSKKSFDRNGNFSLGLKEQIVFPEIDYDKIDKVRGMDITIVTSANTPEEAKFLLQELNFPFKN